MKTILNAKEEAFMEALAILMEEHNVLISAAEGCVGFCVDCNIDHIIMLPQDEVFSGNEIFDFISENT